MGWFYMDGVVIDGETYHPVKALNLLLSVLIFLDKLNNSAACIDTILYYSIYST